MSECPVNCLGHIPSIIEAIFLQLDRSSFNNCALVSKSWNGVVKDVRPKRRQFKWFDSQPEIVR